MNSKNLLALVLGSILALAILISCSSNEESNELSFETIEITQDQLQPFLTFEEDSLVLPFDIAYLSNENLAVLDFELKSVFIYDKNGEFVSRFGREGKKDRENSFNRLSCNPWTIIFMS